MTDFAINNPQLAARCGVHFCSLFSKFVAPCSLSTNSVCHVATHLVFKIIFLYIFTFFFSTNDQVCLLLARAIRTLHKHVYSPPNTMKHQYSTEFANERNIIEHHHSSTNTNKPVNILLIIHQTTLNTNEHHYSPTNSTIHQQTPSHINKHHYFPKTPLFINEHNYISTKNP